MKRINYGDVSYLVGGEVADAMVEYTARLMSNQRGDAVEVNVLGPDGNPEVASFALGPGVPMTAETTRSELDEPENGDAVAYMRAAMSRLTSSTPAPMTAEDLLAVAQTLEDQTG